ncbi:MAG: response regulator [Bacteroidota bacterium]
MKTVFILDTDPSQQNQMKQHLSAMGYAVRSFFTADEFESSNEKPFMIILDEKMENKDRFSMLFLKKVHKKMSRVPVIYMVNRPDRKLINDAKKTGAYEVIEKNSAAFVNLRTTLDKLVKEPTSNWFSRLFIKKQSQNLPALSV